ncbi:MAG: hypothetical protein ACOYM1_11660 [Methylovulum sp.]|jgi:hypothetical protein
MTVSKDRYLKTFYSATQNLGYKAINSDFTFEIKGYEETYLLVKQAPWPELTPQGEIEIVMPLGATRWQPQQVKPAQQGAITLMETMKNHISETLLSIIADGGTFDATIYEGTPQNYLRKKLIWDCFMQIDPVDRDFENRAQILLLSGTLFYHYFGETYQGNSKDYRAGNTKSRAVGNGGPTPSSKYRAVKEDKAPRSTNQFIAR